MALPVCVQFIKSTFSHEVSICYKTKHVVIFMHLRSIWCSCCSHMSLKQYSCINLLKTRICFLNWWVQFSHHGLCVCYLTNDDDPLIVFDLQIVKCLKYTLKWHNKMTPLFTMQGPFIITSWYLTDSSDT